MAGCSWKLYWNACEKVRYRAVGLNDAGAAARRGSLGRPERVASPPGKEPARGSHFARDTLRIAGRRLG